MADNILVSHLVEEVERVVAERARPPLATYRFQFGKDQGFRAAGELASYLNELGISHLYSSPYLKTSSAASHGYAIVDYTRLNPDLGNDADYQAMVEALHEQGMGQILDIVPNHMCVAPPQENGWWTDVLENGTSSPYAIFFDIDWRPVKDELKNKVLLPVLGGQYGKVLEAGELTVEYREGAFFLRYHQTVLPIDPRTYRVMLDHRIEEFRQSGKLAADSEELRELESIITALGHLPKRNDTDPARVAERQREKEVIKSRLNRLTSGCQAVADFIGESLKDINGQPGEPRSFDRLELLVDDQAYRLANWKAAADEINYRRFFDINELAAVCMEHQTVFEQAHQLVFDLLVRGNLDGVRIDHIDGLFNPTEYLWRLQWGYLRAIGRQAYESRGDDKSGWPEIEPQFLLALHRKIGGIDPRQVFPSLFASNGEDAADNAESETPAAEAAPNGFRGVAQPLYVVVEKILSPEEPLPEEWPNAGTTGYDFLNYVNGLFVTRKGLSDLISIYGRFIQQGKVDFGEIAYQARMLILRTAMSSELQMLSYRINRISEWHRTTRDHTFNALRTALREILACFPIYRTYIMNGLVTERDRRFVNMAAAQAKHRNPAREPTVFDFIRDVILLDQPPDLDAVGRYEREVFVGRFQQVTSPVTAKGIEDTAFYRYNPLVSLNEVGGEPARAVVSVAEFHEENLRRRERQPFSLTASSTHDTKRSEDVRARLHVLSEIHSQWRTSVNRWARLNRRWHRDVEGRPAPSRNDEYLFYQALVGIWPLDPPDAEEHQRIIQRVQGYMDKAIHEAKVRTSWISPNADYDAAVREFVAGVLTDSPKNRFLADFRAFHEHVANWGLYNALAQTLLKLTSPGVPDIYQGQEIWDFSLVDPDNRRPVDFGLRRWLLEEVKAKAADGPSRCEFARALAANPRDRRAKLFVTWQGLEFRRQHAELIHHGRYVPLEVEGSHAEHVCAFAWHRPGEGGRAPETAIVAAPRLVTRLAPIPEGATQPLPPVGAEVWQDTRLVLGDLPVGTLTDRFTGHQIYPENGRLALAQAMSDFPLTLLVG